MAHAIWLLLSEDRVFPPLLWRAAESSVVVKGGADARNALAGFEGGCTDGCRSGENGENRGELSTLR